ncbi:MAG: tetratricopeptide repeat protein [Candidatus Sulfotelmatobacter sp.]
MKLARYLRSPGIVRASSAPPTKIVAGNRYSLLFALILPVAVALAAGALWLNAGTTVRLLKRRSLRAPAFLVRLSQEQALKALTKAAEAGDPVAQYKLYESAREADRWRVRRWLDKSAESGYPDAQYERGQLANEEEDYSTAVYWYRRAAAQGHPGAQLELGFKYQLGEGVQLDNFRAYEWFEKAAEGGNAFGAQSIAECSLQGDCPPVVQSYKNAYEWLLITEGLGACLTCDAGVRPKLSPSEIAEANAAAQRFLRLHKLPNSQKPLP